jgi:hypothetical protein
MKLIF